MNNLIVFNGKELTKFNNDLKQLLSDLNIDSQMINK